MGTGNGSGVYSGKITFISPQDSILVIAAYSYNTGSGLTPSIKCMTTSGNVQELQSCTFTGKMSIYLITNCKGATIIVYGSWINPYSGPTGSAIIIG